MRYRSSASLDYKRITALDRKIAHVKQKGQTIVEPKQGIRR